MDASGIRTWISRLLRQNLPQLPLQSNHSGAYWQKGETQSIWSTIWPVRPDCKTGFSETSLLLGWISAMTSRVDSISSSSQLTSRFVRRHFRLQVPRLSFPCFPRIRRSGGLHTDLDTPSLSTIRCFGSMISLCGGSKIDEEIAMIPSTRITKSGCSWDDDLADSLPSIVLVFQRMR